MEISIASWNIEKCGESSDFTKKAKLDHFIWNCCNELNIDVIFLCEVHSSRVVDFLDYLPQTYPNYQVFSLDGGYSNNYIILINRNLKNIILSETPLTYLNRKLLLINFKDSKDLIKASVTLAHFKSGQNQLTKSQISSTSIELQAMTPERWVILGDMNWCYKNISELNIQNASGSTCWDDQSHAKNSILDWCLYSNSNETIVYPFDVKGYFRETPEIFDMTAPDHRPIIFNITFKLD